MMFRSLFFAAAPFFVAGEVEEQSVLLQLKGRDETRALLQRSSVDLSQETLRSLEENLMSKGGKVDTAKCSYHLKTAPSEGELTPCEKLDIYETTFKASMKEFGTFDKIGLKAIKNTMKTIKKALPSFPNMTELNLTFALEAEGLEIKKLDDALNDAVVKLGENSSAADEFIAAMQVLSTDAQADLNAIVAVVEDNIVSVLNNQTVTMPDNTTINPGEAVKSIQLNSKKGLNDAAKLFENYIIQEFDALMNKLGGSMVNFWSEVLDTPDDVAELENIDWASPKEVKKVMKKSFWHFAQAFVDDDENVEIGCTSAKYNPSKSSKFAVRKICKSKKKPKCLDELVYFYEGLNETSDICDAVDELPKSIKGKKFTDAKFKDHCTNVGVKPVCKKLLEDHAWSACKKPKDVTKACKAIEKWQKGAEKREAKEAKRLLKEKKKAAKKDMKACNKVCNKEPRAERKTCKKTCKDTYKEAIKTE